MEKYELTNETIQVMGKTLYRIKSLKDFDDVKTGDLGGFVESCNNLSQVGKSWIYDNAKVFEFALVRGAAKVRDNAAIMGYAKVFDFAEISGEAEVYGDCSIKGYSKVCGNADISGNAIIVNAEISEQARIFGDASVGGGSKVGGNALVFGNALISCKALVSGGCINGYATIYGDAIIQNNSDFIIFQKWWDEGKYITWTRSNDMWYEKHEPCDAEAIVRYCYKQSDLSGEMMEKLVEYVNNIKNIQI